MLKQISLIALCGTFVVFSACSNNKYKKTENGVEYRILQDEKGGKSPATGDIISFHMTVRVGDSVLLNTRQMNGNVPIEMPLMPPAYKGEWVEGFAMLTPGDSAEFVVSKDTLEKYAKGGDFSWIKAGDKITYSVKLVDVKTQEDLKKDEEKQNEIDDQLLQDYFSKNNLNPQKTASGVYYVIEKEGVGPSPATGDKVTVNYTGKTLAGDTFDSNVDPAFNHPQPFSFAVGKGQVISGWDDGIAVLSKGSKAKLFIPSAMAYGPMDQPGIPANSVLIFDVEIIDIEKAQ